jgi:hypothetical protein
VISTPFDAPLFEGSGASDELPGYLQVAINGRPYKIDPRKYKRSTVELLRSPADQNPEPGEQSLNTEGLWPRMQTDWRGGAGQDYFDDGDSDRARFLRSKGIDPWTRRRIKLHYDTALRAASSNTNLKVLVAGSYVYWADGSNLMLSNAVDLATPSTVAAGGAITSLATDGSYVYIARAGALLQRSVIGSGTMAAFSVALQPTLVGYANGRLFGAVANRLCEIDAAGKVATDATPTANLLDYTHRSAAFVWSDFESASNGVYTVGAAGSLSEVYYIGLSTTNIGALTTPIIATPGFPAGETITCLYYYGGAILMGTDRGLRLAVIGANNGLTFGGVREITGGVTAFSGEGRYVWFTWTNYDTTSTGLGRLDLQRFTGTLTPAYASDLMATVQGAVTGVVSFGGKRYFAVSASGVWGQATTLVAEGEMLSGWITYSTHEAKLITSLDVRHDALAGTVAAAVDYEAEDADGGTPIACGTSLTPLSFGPTSAFDAGRRKAEQVQVHLVLRRSASVTTTGPQVRRWSLRSLPSPYRVDIIAVPIIMRSHILVGRDNEQEYPQNVLDEYRYLKSLEGEGALVNYQEGTSSYSAYIKKIEIADVEKWNDEDSFFEGIYTVYFVTAQPSA